MSEASTIGRFAPSITGDAHPGTLLAALLAWLDARSRGGQFLLRFEDLDRSRFRPEWPVQMSEALSWLGLDWDARIDQSADLRRYEAAMDRLEAMGRLYPCACSRTDRQASGRRGPDGSWAYDNRCRRLALPEGGWREAAHAVRVRLDDTRIELRDESGLELSQNPAVDMGDPIVLRREGGFAYHLVVVVDDAASAVTRIVRGRDIAPSTATHVALQRLLGVPTPSYRHHLLLLQPHGDKLAKFHASVGYATLRTHYRPEALCGWLACVAGLKASEAPLLPRDLVDGFDWSRVGRSDRVVTWDGERLIAGAAVES